MPIPLHKSWYRAVLLEACLVTTIGNMTFFYLAQEKLDEAVKSWSINVGILANSMLVLKDAFKGRGSLELVYEVTHAGTRRDELVKILQEQKRLISSPDFVYKVVKDSMVERLDELAQKLIRLRKEVRMQKQEDDLLKPKEGISRDDKSQVPPRKK